MRYTLWHCETSPDGPPGHQTVYDINALLTANSDAYGPLNAFHWWGKPQLGYYCLSSDNAQSVNALKKHAEMLRDAGIDFVFLDMTNWPYVMPYTVRHVLDPYAKMLASWSAVPGAPKIVPWVPVPTRDVSGAPQSCIDNPGCSRDPDGNFSQMTYSSVTALMEQYPAMSYSYEGKPLFMVCDYATTGNKACGTAVDTDAGAMTNLQASYNTRLMWTGTFGAPDLPSASRWSYMERCRAGDNSAYTTQDDAFRSSGATIDCNQAYSTFASNGKPEAVPVTTAYYYTAMSATRSVAQKFGGKTFAKQFKTAFDLKQSGNEPAVVLIEGWNEWLVQRAYCAPGLWWSTVEHQCVEGNDYFNLSEGGISTDMVPDRPGGNKMFQDMYKTDYNRDIEPAQDVYKDYYYQLLKYCIANYKTGLGCDVNTVYQVKGYIDGVSIDGGGHNYVNGWACSHSTTTSIDVHMYAGNSVGPENFLTAVRAGDPSELAVSAECGTSGTHAYRFSIPLDSYISSYAGKNIYIYGISPFPAMPVPLSNNNNLANHGLFHMPDDGIPPNVTGFTIPATAASLTVAITAFTATDNVGVTGYMATESASAPSAGAVGWSGSAPTSYTFGTAGAKTLYAWAKDAAGNVSSSLNNSVTITLADVTAPTVTGFAIPATATSLTVAITAFTASDNVGVTGYMATESASAPSAGAAGWAASAPLVYSFSSTGVKTLYAWAKDAAGNVSASSNASVTIDVTAPSVTTFSVPVATASLTVPIIFFTATDNVVVTGYMVTASPIVPSPGAAAWSLTPPNVYTFPSAGTKTLYAWARDGYGNVSEGVSASVIVDMTAPAVAITSPAGEASVSGSVSVSASASDNAGVDRIEFSVDGTLKRTDVSAPYSFVLDTSLLSASPHTVAARVYDIAGNNSQAQVVLNVSAGPAVSELFVDGLSGGVAQAEDGVTVTIPAGAYGGAVYIGISTPVAGQLSAADSNTGDSLKIENVNLAREFHALDAAGNAAGSFYSPVFITMCYPDADNDGIVDGNGIKEELLGMYYLDAAVARWSPVPGLLTRDTAANSVRTAVGHFSVYSLRALNASKLEMSQIRAYPSPCYFKNSNLTVGGVPVAASDVRIYIYSAAGVLVRKLEKGSGVDSGNVGKWDGRNQAGEKVASGIYVYLVKTANYGSKYGKVAVLW